MKNTDRIAARFERAGGALSEASQLLAHQGQETIAINSAVRNVNIMVSDLRSAIMKLDRGEDSDTVMLDLDQRWSKLWPLESR